ncbi:hypothetical protein FHR81_001385 [Actinoalloteichus hoggarensis]|uniref:Uncharacterized protein n=1 Tax=Actinoalloteichus hoggarensis TaxID=1470176 RepID=A0A221W016_9PSEU|nr:hypothetical protein [Actinoalloteichus hoggarensis]ASO19119.1 hypothetical protein AHOG_07360 [Actinoalloteichus hoggarensis]MBB5920355.1 hypothetical protein [Actinoalloteichus hoggarensis]
MVASAWGATPANDEVGSALELAWRLRWSAPEVTLLAGERARRLATEEGDHRSRLTAELLALFALNRLGRGVVVVERGIAALREIEAERLTELSAPLRVELAHSARIVGAPLIAFGLLRPVLEDAGLPSEVRAAGLLELAECLPGGSRDEGWSQALSAADRLYESDAASSRDDVAPRRAMIQALRAGFHRRRGEPGPAEECVLRGLDLLGGVRSSATDGGQADARLRLERAHLLLDGGRTDLAVEVCRSTLARPVRAAAASALGWLRVVLATRLHLPAGEPETARELLLEAAAGARRHGLDPLLSESLQALSYLYEAVDELPEALRCLRAAHAAEQRRQRAVSAARLQLAAEFSSSVGDAAALKATLTDLLRTDSGVGSAESRAPAVASTTSGAPGEQTGGATSGSPPTTTWRITDPVRSAGTAADPADSGDLAESDAPVHSGAAARQSSRYPVVGTGTRDLGESEASSGLGVPGETNDPTRSGAFVSSDAVDGSGAVDVHRATGASADDRSSAMAGEPGRPPAVLPPGVAVPPRGAVPPEASVRAADDPAEQAGAVPVGRHGAVDPPAATRLDAVEGSDAESSRMSDGSAAELLDGSNWRVGTDPTTPAVVDPPGGGSAPSYWTPSSAVDARSTASELPSRHAAAEHEQPPASDIAVPSAAATVDGRSPAMSSNWQVGGPAVNRQDEKTVVGDVDDPVPPTTVTVSAEDDATEPSIDPHAAPTLVDPVSADPVPVGSDSVRSGPADSASVRTGADSAPPGRFVEPAATPDVSPSRFSDSADPASTVPGPPRHGATSTATTEARPSGHEATPAEPTRPRHSAPADLPFSGGGSLGSAAPQAPATSVESPSSVSGGSPTFATGGVPAWTPSAGQADFFSLPATTAAGSPDRHGAAQTAGRLVEAAAERGAAADAESSMTRRAESAADGPARGDPAAGPSSSRAADARSGAGARSPWSTSPADQTTPPQGIPTPESTIPWAPAETASAAGRAASATEGGSDSTEDVLLASEITAPLPAVRDDDPSPPAGGDTLPSFDVSEFAAMGGEIDLAPSSLALFRGIGTTDPLLAYERAAEDDQEPEEPSPPLPFGMFGGGALLSPSPEPADAGRTTGDPVAADEAAASSVSNPSDTRSAFIASSDAASPAVVDGDRAAAEPSVVSSGAAGPVSDPAGAAAVDHADGTGTGTDTAGAPHIPPASEPPVSPEHPPGAQGPGHARTSAKRAATAATGTASDQSASWSTITDPPADVRLGDPFAASESETATPDTPVSPPAAAPSSEGAEQADSGGPAATAVATEGGSRHRDRETATESDRVVGGEGVAEAAEQPPADGPVSPIRRVLTEADLSDQHVSVPTSGQAFKFDSGSERTGGEASAGFEWSMHTDDPAPIRPEAVTPSPLFAPSTSGWEPGNDVASPPPPSAALPWAVGGPAMPVPEVGGTDAESEASASDERTATGPGLPYFASAAADESSTPAGYESSESDLVSRSAGLGTDARETSMPSAAGFGDAALGDAAAGVGADSGVGAAGADAATRKSGVSGGTGAPDVGFSSGTARGSRAVEDASDVPTGPIPRIHAEDEIGFAEASETSTPPFGIALVQPVTDTAPAAGHGPPDRPGLVSPPPQPAPSGPPAATSSSGASAPQVAVSPAVTPLEPSQAAEFSRQAPPHLDPTGAGLASAEVSSAETPPTESPQALLSSVPSPAETAPTPPSSVAAVSPPAPATSLPPPVEPPSAAPTGDPRTVTTPAANTEPAAPQQEDRRPADPRPADSPKAPPAAAAEPPETARPVAPPAPVELPAAPKPGGSGTPDDRRLAQDQPAGARAGSGEDVTSTGRLRRVRSQLRIGDLLADAMVAYESTLRGLELPVPPPPAPRIGESGHPPFAEAPGAGGSPPRPRSGEGDHGGEGPAGIVAPGDGPRLPPEAARADLDPSVRSQPGSDRQTGDWAVLPPRRRPASDIAADSDADQAWTPPRECGG